MNPRLERLKKKPHRLKGAKNPCKGPLQNFEEQVEPDWWEKIFNFYYLKTDADLVEDEKITKQEVDFFAKILSLKKQDRFLDLCCGQGRHSLGLAAQGFLNFVGLDRSRYLIQKARSRAKKMNLPALFKEGDARKLPFGSESFDYVLILGNSFGYLKDQTEDLTILSEVWRVLKKGGKLLVDITDGEYIRQFFEPRSWEWIDQHWFVCRERELSSNKDRLISREIITQVEKGVKVDQFYAERLYSFAEMEKLLQNATFHLVQSHKIWEANSARNMDYGMMRRRMIITAKKEEKKNVQL